MSLFPRKEAASRCRSEDMVVNAPLLLKCAIWYEYQGGHGHETAHLGACENGGSACAYRQRRQWMLFSVSCLFVLGHDCNRRPVLRYGVP